MRSKVKNLRWRRWYDAFAPTAQMFHGLGKGLGRGRGPRLAEPPAAKEPPNEETRSKILVF
ncbi:hypothetical protein RxyAA322_02070 [Rubrobacter xylanophilus]|uniref:Uncharacterized protein n=1 Tax=Rubrobacter xylanophilus TaxID=49319 RepID=A0A510HI65_9ACTN|nr:hypothetical protein [Rubrobacter xylanophilus]BBL78353.1 hypothetical protein RxyAA322_02070 [Rubrobacter xylanophilus]